MNKKGFFSVITFLISFTVIVLAISLLYFQANPEIRNNPISNLTWTEKSPATPTNNTLTIVIYNFVNFIGDSMFRIAGEISNWAFHNPNITSPQLLMTLLILFLLSPVVVTLFKIIVIIVILIKEVIQSRREKRKLKGGQ